MNSIKSDQILLQAQYFHTFLQDNSNLQSYNLMYQKESIFNVHAFFTRIYLNKIINLIDFT